MVDFVKLTKHWRANNPHVVAYWSRQAAQSKSGYERYVGNCAPLQAAQRLTALEGWLEYERAKDSLL